MNLEKGVSMKYLLILALIISTRTLAAEEASNVQEPTQAPPVEEPDNWPTLEKFWFEKNHESEFVNALIGTPTAEVKLGYEYSDLDGNGTDSANALISRIRLNYQSGNYKGLEAFVQAQYVGPIVDQYAPEDSNYDTVADPEAFRFHQLYLAYNNYNTLGKIGSQEILLDNQRFIGNVGWRFNAQSFNAALIQNESVDNLKLFYAYTDSINEPDGENNDERQYHLFNGQYGVGENNKVSVYAYLQRNDLMTLPDELDTYGARFWGKNGTFVHNAMLAGQREAYYAFLSGKLDFEPADAEVGIEYISGGADPKEQFQTLNGTAHAFNGWADQFLGTGGGLPGGLVDLWLKGSGMIFEKTELIGVYHYFGTASDAAGFSGTYGNEIDLMAKQKVHENFDLSATLAYYIKADGDIAKPTADETVFWLRGTWRF
jgi:hypothetical protein